MARADLSREVRLLKGNAPEVLDVQDCAWVVEDGTLALFLTALANGVPEGPRRFICQLGTGDAAFTFLPRSPQSSGLLAVAITETRLQPAPAMDLIHAAMEHSTSAERCIAGWVQNLSRVTGVAPPEIPAESATALHAALVRFETECIDAFSDIEKDRQDAEWTRLQRRWTLSQDLSRQAMSDLASVLSPLTQAESPRDGAPLQAALSAIAECLKVKLKAAAEADKRTDPLVSRMESAGLRTRQVLLTGDWWKTENGPLLAFTAEGNLPVALLPLRHGWIRRGCYEVFDPSAGTRHIADASVAKGLSPQATTFYRPLQERVGSLDLLRFALQGRFRDLAVVLGCGFAATLLGMLTPQATSVLVEFGIPDANRPLVMQLGMGLLAAAIGSMLFDLAQSLSLLRMEIGSSSILQCGVWDRLLKLSPGFFRKYSAGDLAARANAVNQIRQQLSGATLRSMFIGFTGLLNLALMFYYSPTLAAATLVFGVIVVAFFSWSGVLITRLSTALQEKEGHLFGSLVQLIHGVPKLRVAGAEGRAFAFWARGYSQQQKVKLRIQQIQDRTRLFNVFLPALSAALIFGMVAEVLTADEGSAAFSLGTFLAFNAAFGTFLAGLTELSGTGIGMLGVAALWKRARTILSEPAEVDASKSHPGKISGRVSMNHVTFRYRTDGRLTLEDITIDALPGQCTALVGPSGSGKSTILNLLLRFEVPSSGAVYYDGQDLNGLDVTAVRRQVGVVLQENNIMAGSIFDNIVSGSLCTLQDAWDAAKAAAFAEDIERMPMGMHTPVSEGGTNISGGQRQRLLIARALVSKPSILIFDEATSALDNRTQATVTDSLRRLKVTTILVAHRLSTIRHADRIYVIDAGRIVQQGSFDELAGQEGLFARLIARQAV